MILGTAAIDGVNEAGKLIAQEAEATGGRQDTDQGVDPAGGGEEGGAFGEVFEVDVLIVRPIRRRFLLRWPLVFWQLPLRGDFHKDAIDDRKAVVAYAVKGREGRTGGGNGGGFAVAGGSDEGDPEGGPFGPAGADLERDLVAEDGAGEGEKRKGDEGDGDAGLERGVFKPFGDGGWEAGERERQVGDGVVEVGQGRRSWAGSDREVARRIVNPYVRIEAGKVRQGRENRELKMGKL